MNVLIPEKLYFKIGEVSEITGVKPHVLRYWEAEFGSFRPAKSKNQQRLFRRKDIELVLHLKDLLYNQGFTIIGARKKLQERPVGKGISQTGRDRRLVDEIRQDLKRLRDSL